MRSLARVRLGACLIGIALGTAPALAQKPPPAQPTQAAKDSARGLAEQGFELYEAGRYAEAISHFQQAEERFHALPHLLFIARAQLKLGKLVEARDTYDKIVREQLANYAPDAFRQAQGDARRELEELHKRIPTIQLVVIGAEPESIRVTLDGAEVPGWKIQERLPVNPGAHAIVATKAGAAPIKRSVTVEEAAAERVDLTFSASPQAPPPDDSPPERVQPSLVPAIIAFGIGGIALGVGAVTGAMSLAKVSDIESQCGEAPDGGDKVCDPKFESDAEDARTLGTVSTIAFVAGGVGVAAGVVLLITGLGADDSPPASSGGSRAAPSLRPQVGLGSVGLTGRF